MSDDEVLAAVRVVLDESVRPRLQAHGGDVTVDVTDGIVDVRFLGACVACELRTVTHAATVRQRLLSVEGVQAVTCRSVAFTDTKLDSIAAFFA